MRGAVVRVSLRTDTKSGAGKWFSFSTVYSSPDVSGGDCMQEAGAAVGAAAHTESSSRTSYVWETGGSKKESGGAQKQSDAQNDLYLI